MHKRISKSRRPNTTKKIEQKTGHYRLKSRNKFNKRNIFSKKQCRINIQCNKKNIQRNKQKQKPTIIKQRNKTQKHNLQHFTDQPKFNKNEDFYKAKFLL